MPYHLIKCLSIDWQLSCFTVCVIWREKECHLDYTVIKSGIICEIYTDLVLFLFHCLILILLHLHSCSEKKYHSCFPFCSIFCYIIISNWFWQQTHTHIVPGTNDDCEKQITTRIKFNVCVSYLFFDSANNCSVVDINQRA